MVNFQIATLIIASIVLLITLSFIAISLRNVKTDSKYPPVVAECPDYWLAGTDDIGNKCVNNHVELGTSTCSKTMRFSESQWLGETGMCNKKNWAKDCKLTWDGVTNSNKDLCRVPVS